MSLPLKKLRLILPLLLVVVILGSGVASTNSNIGSEFNSVNAQSDGGFSVSPNNFEITLLDSSSVVLSATLSNPLDYDLEFRPLLDTASASDFEQRNLDIDFAEETTVVPAGDEIQFTFSLAPESLTDYQVTGLITLEQVQTERRLAEGDPEITIEVTSSAATASLQRQREILIGISIAAISALIIAGVLVSDYIKHRRTRKKSPATAPKSS